MAKICCLPFIIFSSSLPWCICSTSLFDTKCVHGIFSMRLKVHISKTSSFLMSIAFMVHTATKYNKTDTNKCFHVPKFCVKLYVTTDTEVSRTCFNAPLAISIRHFISFEIQSCALLSRIHKYTMSLNFMVLCYISFFFAYNHIFWVFKICLML